jgi:hypothetical protein
MAGMKEFALEMAERATRKGRGRKEGRKEEREVMMRMKLWPCRGFLVDGLSGWPVTPNLGTWSCWCGAKPHYPALALAGGSSAIRAIEWELFPSRAYTSASKDREAGRSALLLASPRYGLGDGNGKTKGSAGAT